MLSRVQATAILLCLQHQNPLVCMWHVPSLLPSPFSPPLPLSFPPHDSTQNFVSDGPPACQSPHPASIGHSSRVGTNFLAPLSKSIHAKRLFLAQQYFYSCLVDWIGTACLVHEVTGGATEMPWKQPRFRRTVWLTQQTHNTPCIGLLG